jgi:hypothetical protein
MTSLTAKMLLRTKELIPILFPENNQSNPDDAESEPDDVQNDTSAWEDDESDDGSITPVTMTEEELDHQIMTSNLQRYTMQWLSILRKQC